MAHVPALDHDRIPEPRSGRQYPDVADDVLVGLVVAGDRHAHETLLRRHQGRIYRLALRMLDDPYDAEDAAQDVMARLPAALRSFRGTSSFPTWLHRVVVNQCLKQIHRRQRDRHVEHAETDALSPGADAVVVSRQRSAAVLVAVAALGPALQAVLVLCEFDGLSYSEAAEVLGLPESTVRGRLSRARRALVPSLQQWIR